MHLQFCNPRNVSDSSALEIANDPIQCEQGRQTIKSSSARRVRRLRSHSFGRLSAHEGSRVSSIKSW
jgi:hypothetical protein